MIVNAVVCEALRIVSEEGLKLPVYISQNVDGYSNDDLFLKYRNRIKYL